MLHTSQSQPNGNISEMQGYKNQAVAYIFQAPRLTGAAESVSNTEDFISSVVNKRQDTCLLFSVQFSSYKVMVSRGCRRVQYHDVEVGLVQTKKTNKNKTKKN